MATFQGHRHGLPMPSIQFLLTRLSIALEIGWAAFCRAWSVTGTLDGRERRHRLRLAALDDRDIERLETTGPDHHEFREELYRRGIVR